MEQLAATVASLTTAIEALRTDMTRSFSEASDVVSGLTNRVQALEVAAASERTRPDAGSSGHAAPPSTPAPAPAGASTSHRTLALPKPPKYSGGMKDALPWVTTVETYVHINNVHGPDAVIYAGALLEGNAKTWFMAQQAQHGGALHAGWQSFDAFKAAFLAQFQEQFPADRARDRLANLRQKTSVALYAAEFQNLLIHLPHRDMGDNIHSFIRGLKPDIAKSVATLMPATLADAIDMAIKADGATLQVLRMQRSPYAPRHGPTPMDVNNIESDTDEEELAALSATQQEREKLMKEGRCFYCKEHGHTKRDCPKHPNGQRRKTDTTRR